MPLTGAAAAMEIIKLMERTATAIPPKKLVDTYVEAGGKPVVAALDMLWDEFGEATIGVMADGAQTLARIWSGAWKGHKIPAAKQKVISLQTLRNLYEDVDFVPSLDLDNIASKL